MGNRSLIKAALGFIAVASGTSALDLDVSSQGSLSNASSVIAANVIGRYGNYSGQIPGLFQSKSNDIYFWDAGLAWDTLIYYYAQTGDDQYNDIVRLALQWQESPTLNFMPANQSRSLGNDDQANWALAAMTAAEQGFPEPEGNTTYLQLAQNVFDSQAARWDNQTCAGGLRWQIFSFNNGYSYKNSISNGDFFLLAARLARFTGNSTYHDWAERAYAWSKQVGLIARNGAVYDGTSATINCTQINRIQWTSNAGVYIQGMAYLSNSSFAGASADGGALADLNMAVESALTLFTNDNQTLYEISCEGSGQVTCMTDQWTFRGILARSLATVQYVGAGLDDNTTSTISTILQHSAQGAAGACSGGANGTSCGGTWTTGAFDDRASLQSDLSALNVMLANIPVQRIADQNNTAEAGSSATGTTDGNSTGTESGSPAAASTGAASTLAGSMGMLAALAAAVVGFA